MVSVIVEKHTIYHNISLLKYCLEQKQGILCFGLGFFLQSKLYFSWDISTLNLYNLSNMVE